jgi:hypothetical protein
MKLATWGLSTDVSRKFKYEKMPASMLCGDGISPFSIIVSRTFRENVEVRVARILQEWWKGVKRVFQGCCRGVRRM